MPTIVEFCDSVTTLPTKTRPKKLAIIASDGHRSVRGCLPACVHMWAWVWVDGWMDVGGC